MKLAESIRDDAHGESDDNRDQRLKKELEGENGALSDFRQALHLDPTDGRIKIFESLVSDITNLSKNIRSKKDREGKRRENEEKNFRFVTSFAFWVAASLVAIIPVFFILPELLFSFPLEFLDGAGKTDILFQRHALWHLSLIAAGFAARISFYMMLLKQTHRLETL